MHLSSEEETLKFGRELGIQLKPGSLLFFHGDLGAGKTTLIKGIGNSLGIPEEELHSPTFTLMQLYSGDRARLCHIDLYRLNDIEEFLSLSLEEFFDEETIVCVEWPERIEGLNIVPTHRVFLRHRGEGREVEIDEV